MKKVQIFKWFSFYLLLNLPRPWRFLDAGQLSWADINITTPTVAQTITYCIKLYRRDDIYMSFGLFLLSCDPKLWEPSVGGRGLVWKLSLVSGSLVESNWKHCCFVCCQCFIAWGGDELVLMGLCVCSGVWRHSGGCEFQRVAQGISLAPGDAGSAWASAGLAAGGSFWDYKKSSDIMANINRSV